MAQTPPATSRAPGQCPRGVPALPRHGCLSLSMSLCLCWDLCWPCSACCCLSSPSSPSLFLLCFFPPAVPSSQCLKRSLTTGNLLLFLPPNLFTKSRYKLHAEPALHSPGLGLVEELRLRGVGEPSAEALPVQGQGHQSCWKLRPCWRLQPRGIRKRWF